MVKNSNFRKIFLPVDSVDPEDSESLGYKNFSEFWKIFWRSLIKQQMSLNHSESIQKAPYHNGPYGTIVVTL